MANFVKDIQKEFGTMKLEQLHPNEGQIKGVPRNPRTITEEEFKKLKKSLKNFRKMLYLRPMVVDEDFNILGGNMRYRALVKLAEEHAKIGAFEFTDDIPDEWVKQDCTLTEKEKREFVLKDNKERGETDWDIIANEWDTMEMQEWDIDLPSDEPVEQAADSETGGGEINKSEMVIASVTLFGQESETIVCEEIKPADAEKLLSFIKEHGADALIQKILS